MKAEKVKNKKRYKNIWFVMCYIVLLGFSFVLLSYLMRPVTNSRKNLCGFYAEPNNSLDMVYVGGSACYVYWEPLRAWNQYGFTSFNFATDALQPQSIKYSLEEIRKTQAPQVYIIDIRPFQYGDIFHEEENVRNMDRVASFRNVVDNMKFSMNRYELIRDWAPTQEEKWTYQFDISKYHSNIEAVINPTNWQYIFNEKSLYTKGFYYYQGKEPLPFAESIQTEELPLEAELDSIFIDLLDYCQDENLQVLFIVHAYCNQEEDQKKYNYMERRVKEYGQGFLNVNDYFFDIGFDVENDFNDTNHVNLLGADKYSEFLAGYLAEHYDLPDHRVDPNYNQWNIDFIRWNGEMEEVRKEMNEDQ